MSTAAATTSTLSDSTRLAIDRTRLAHERTLMAWVRTSTSLISFGFTIYKFFQYLQDSADRPVPDRLIGPTQYAMLMIALGVIALAIASLEHRRSLQELQRQYGDLPRSNALYLGAVHHHCRRGGIPACRLPPVVTPQSVTPQSVMDRRVLA
jgi:putative membrane protein